jgi:transcriptional regulator with XRE-family HTH domain
MREIYEYRQIKLATLLGVKQSTYSNYENGVVNIPVESLIRLAALYKTSVDYLVGSTDERKPYPPSKRRGLCTK